MRLARDAFEANIGNPKSALARLQLELAAWQSKNFGAQPAENITLGVCEEAGELAHVVLKRNQRIRGMGDDEAYREALADAAGDICIYLMQLLTLHRLDFETVVTTVATRVLQRDWTADPHGGVAVAAVARCLAHDFFGSCPLCAFDRQQAAQKASGRP